MKTRTMLATTTLVAAATGGALSTAAPAHAEGHVASVNATHHAKAATSTFVAKRLPRQRALDCTMKGDAPKVTGSRMLKDGNYVVWVNRAQLTSSGAVTLTATVQRHVYNHGDCPQTGVGKPVHTVVPASTTVGVLGVDDEGPTALTGPAWMLPRVTNPAWYPAAPLYFSSTDHAKHYRVPTSVASSLWGNGLAHLTVKHGKVATFQVLYQP